MAVLATFIRKATITSLKFSCSACRFFDTTNLILSYISFAEPLPHTDISQRPLCKQPTTMLYVRLRTGKTRAVKQAIKALKPFTT